MRILLAPILSFCTFLHSSCLNIKVLYNKKFDLAIIQEDTIFLRILSRVYAELSWAYTQYEGNWVKLILSMRGTELNLYGTQYMRNEVKLILSISVVEPEPYEP